MSLRHVVLFKFADLLDDGYVELVRSGLDALPPQIAEIRRYVHGVDIGLRDSNWDYAVVADFDSADDFVAYRDHPIHQRFIDEVITGNVVERAAVQYET